MFEIDGTGERFDGIDFPSYPTYPNNQLYIGGLPDGNVKRGAIERLNKNDVYVRDNFYGCMKEMTIDTTNEYYNFEVK